MNELRRLLRYAKPYRGRLIAALGGMVLYALGQLGIIYQVQPIFNDVLKLQTLASANSNVAKVGLMIVAFYVLKGIGAYVSGYLMSDVGQRVVRDVRNQLFRHTLGQSAAFFARRSSGTLLSRLTNDVSQVQTAVSETLADLTRESIAVVVIVVYLFVTDWRLALVFLTSAPLIVYPLTQLGQRVRRTTRRGQEELEHLTHLASEAFSGHRIVKAFGAEEREARRFANSAEGLYRTYMRIISAVSVLPPLMELIGGIAAVAALWYGALQIADGKLTPGEFSSFLVAGFTMYGPIKKLSRVNASIQQTIAASERIFETLDTHTEVRELVDAPVLPRLRRGVQFKMVGFSYEDRADKFVLREIDLDVAAGQVVALVGLSGAGKTSLVNLLPRFYDVTEGAVLIDGIDIRTVSLKSLRDQIALVTQETVLFDDTIAANIAYGVPQASPGAIEAAARAAHAHEFISLLPNGYSARIGERGQRLSGGQRQRLAIARALLKDSPLLILDEATSSLDAESELLVQDALTNLMRNRTTFVIAHRLSTVRRADLIVALEGGRVMEIGTHDELLGNPDGVYAKLYALQTFDEKDRSGAAADTVDSTDGQEENPA